MVVAEKPFIKSACSSERPGILGARIVCSNPFLKGLALEMIEPKPVALLDYPERRKDRSSYVSVLFDRQTNRERLSGELISAVAALMMEETVVVVVQPGTGRDHDHDGRTGAEDTEDFTQRRYVIGHVLKQVGADQGIHTAIGDRKAACVALDGDGCRYELGCLLQTGHDQIDTDEASIGQYTVKVFEEIAGRAAQVDNDW